MINGELIKKRRLEMGLSQPALAKLCGYVNRSAICMLEKGNYDDIPFSKAVIIATVLEIKIEELWK